MAMVLQKENIMMFDRALISHVRVTNYEYKLAILQHLTKVGCRILTECTEVMIYYITHTTKARMMMMSWVGRFSVVTQYETKHKGNFHRKGYFQIPIYAGHHRPAERHLNAFRWRADDDPTLNACWFGSFVNIKQTIFKYDCFLQNILDLNFQVYACIFCV